MQAYTSFAEVYDIFMDNIPYEEWADYLDEMHTEEYLKWFFITKNHPTIDIYFDKDTHEFIGFTPEGE